ncbi:proteasome subunit beta 2 [Aeropyrum pernix]|uniref:Proteasome subunit beta n=1 Tax=Aeropyrum pernix TaxID=56636 RepID=A0A401H8I0_AERPX|nr:proteasome subunit beta 2 [Aeropyrum pernix]
MGAGCKVVEWIAGGLEGLAGRGLDERVVRSGTTTVGLIASDHVILAADKRATAGFLIASRRVKKIVMLSNYVAMTVSGLVADAQILSDVLREEIRLYEMTNKVKPSVKSVATLLSNILFSSKFFPYIVQLIVGGYDTQPRLYTLDLFGSITEDKYTATGSGSPIAYGVLEERYREDLSVEEAIKVATTAIRSAVLRDAASGDGADVVVIGPQGYEEKFIPYNSLV